MKHCDHCGKECKKRVPVMMDGSVAMVGTGCAKKFKRAKRVDMSSHIPSGHPSIHGPITIAGYGPDEPATMSEVDFANRFLSKGVTVSGYESLHNFKGFGILVRKSKTSSPAIRYKSGCVIEIGILDPYIRSSGPIFYELEHETHPLFGQFVKQRADNGDPDYSTTLQELLDAYPKWDPIDKYCQPVSYTKPLTDDSNDWKRTGHLSPQKRFASGVHVRPHANLSTEPNRPVDPQHMTSIPFGTVPSKKDLLNAVKINRYGYKVYEIDALSLPPFELKQYDLQPIQNWDVDELWNYLDINISAFVRHRTTSSAILHLGTDKFLLSAYILWTLGYIWP